MNQNLPAPQSIRLADIRVSIIAGLDVFRAIPGPSMAYALVFVLIGTVLLAALGHFGVSPMALPFAGGFMLVGPVLLAGFFHLSDLHRAGSKPGLGDAFNAFAKVPVGLWLVALICSFLFLIWITDAGVLYSFMIGGEHLPYELPWILRLQGQVVGFELWAGLMGSVLAYIIFCISAFSVPLLYQGRADPVKALNASVRAVLGNFLTAIGWGLVLSLGIILSILLLPLLLVSFPVLAYASYDLYLRVFPTGDSAPDRIPANR